MLILQPHHNRLGNVLNLGLQDPRWTTFRAAVAFVKRSGIKHIADSLRAFSRRGHIRMAVGVDVRGTSVEGLTALLECVGGRGEVWVFHNENGPSFHPKMYVFSNDRNAEVIIGSGNLTQGGLFENYEASIILALDLANPDDRSTLAYVDAVLDAYADPEPGTALALSSESVERLRTAGYIVPEAQMPRPNLRPARGDQEYGVLPTEGQLFQHVVIPPPPTIPVFPPVDPPPTGVAETPVAFYMTLQQTDAGSGQTTPGAARRSPEIFVPLAARNAAQEFWQWPEGFTEDPQTPGKMDRTGVRMAIGDEVVLVSMTYFPHRHEFRLRHERLRSAGTIGDILRIERTDDPPDYDYSVTVFSQGSPSYEGALARCSNAVSGRSQKRWGYE